MLAACASGPVGPGVGPIGPDGTQPEATLAMKPGVTPPFMVGQPITRVGMLLPFRDRPQDADAFSQAAELALFEQGGPDMLLLPRESGAARDTGQNGAEGLVRDGADIIIGPIFAQAVSGAGESARRRNVPVIGFSTDSTVAGDGVYLLSFPLEEEVARVVDYASRRGVRSFAILFPETEYGRRVEQAFRREVAARQGTVAAARGYARNERAAADAARAIAPEANAAGVQALMVADGGATLRAVGPGLVQGGLDLRRVRLLGTGEWAASDTLREPTLAGGWYAAPDPAARQPFEARFREAYGRAPTRLAGLAYDAVALTALMARNGGAAGVNRVALERGEGFLGVDGPFRFRPDGTIQRALAILEVRSGGAIVADPAPRRFDAPSS